MDLLARLRAVGLPTALLLAAAVPTSAQAAGFADGFGARPILPPGATTPPSYFSLTSEPGEEKEHSAVLSNGSKRTLRVIVDGVDGLTGTTSGVVYANRDDRHLETSRWLRMKRHHITLKPGQSERFRFTVRVPADAQPGDHLAGLAFQDVHEKTSKSNYSVKQVIRVVLGVEISIPGGSAPVAHLGKLSIAPLPGTQVPSVVMQIANGGQTLCKPKVRVTLTPQGGKTRQVDQQLDTVLPGDEISYPVAFKGALEAGKYQAHATVDDCGGHQEANAAAVLKTDLTGTTPQASTPLPQPSSSTSLWLLLGVGGGGLGGGLLIAFLMLRRRRPPEPPSSTWVATR